MEIIAKISKGSKMDQIYIPKNRQGFVIGNYVLVKQIEMQEIIKTEKKEGKIEKPYFYNIQYIEPIKLEIINKTFTLIEKNIEKYDNLIITGSFLDKGFNFNDIDILLITENKINPSHLANSIENMLGIKTHIIILDNKTLIEGLSIDPLYQMMLSKCVSKKRLIYKYKRKIDYKLLDLHLLKSKVLIDNFDILSGNEKYYLARNMVAIFLFTKNKKISLNFVDSEIKKIFNLQSIDKLKENLIDKNKFIKKYKEIYEKTFELILKNIKNKNEPKQK